MATPPSLSAFIAPYIDEKTQATVIKQVKENDAVINSAAVVLFAGLLTFSSSMNLVVGLAGFALQKLYSKQVMDGATILRDSVLATKTGKVALILLVYGLAKYCPTLTVSFTLGYYTASTFDMPKLPSAPSATEAVDT